MLHSLKDAHSASQGLVIAAIPQRTDPRDAIGGGKLRELKFGATVGTPRRIAQLRRVRPDSLHSVDPGNIDTRINKVEKGETHAIALVRRGFAGSAGAILSPKCCSDIVLPAVGQGVAIEILKRAPAMKPARILTIRGHASP